MSGNLLVRFDEGRVGRTASVALSPTLPRDAVPGARPENWISQRRQARKEQPRAGSEDSACLLTRAAPLE